MYGFHIQLSMPFDAAVAAVTEALKTEGFGVLSTIDMQAAMKEKLGVDMPPYVILGACNPPLAHRALEAEPAIGLLLPCNVIVREIGESDTGVGFIDPQTLVGLTGSPQVQEVADDAGERLRRVREKLQPSTGRPQ